MGTPQFAVPPLNALSQERHEILAIYAQPPREKGRGHKVQKNPTHLWGDERGIPVFTPISLRSEEEVARFQSHKADIAVVVAYGLILPKQILDIPPLGCVNIHGSLLPRWRGAAPIQRAIMAGDAKTGITTMLMDEGLDTGPILEMAELDITHCATAQTLTQDMSDLGARLIVSTLKNLKSLTPIKQPEEGITYAHKLQKSEGHLDFTKSATELDFEIRGLIPIVSVWYEPLGVKILKAIPITQSFSVDIGNFCIQDEKVFIQCGEGVLLVLEVQKEGGKPMATQEFLRGFKQGENNHA